MKRCGHCKRVLGLDNFSTAKTKDGLRNWCKECTRVDNRSRYAVYDNAGKLRNKRNAERRTRLKQEIVNRFGGKCARCGYHEFVAGLDFHHVDGTKKEHNIAKLLTLSLTNIDKLLIEIDKCVLLCRNCHASLHAGMFEYP
jgi:hypothetical protein